MSTLKEIMDCKDKSPYEKSIRGKVVCAGDPVTYTNAQKETRQAKTVAIADNSMAVKVICYDPAKFARLATGSTLMVRNFVRRDSSIILTSASKLFPTQAITLPECMTSQGENLVHPPPAPVVALRKALSSPPKVKVSVCGKIVQDEEEREVMVRDVPTKIRNIFIQDPSMEKVKVALWRNTCPELRTGNHVKVSDVIVNIYRNETTLNTTFTSLVTKMEQPITSILVKVIGACVEDDKTELLLSDDTVKVVNSEMLSDALPEGSAAESFFMERGETQVVMRVKGTDVCSLQLKTTLDVES